ncbi:MAG: NAD(P)-binding protein [Myxococcota bacterium]
MSEHFDVAVVGTQTAGLIAAALLAKRERRVIVLDHGENVRFYRHHGVHMPLVPTLVPSLEDSPPIKKVHDALGIGPDIRSNVTVEEPSFQAVTATHRIDVSGKQSSFLEELGQEFPDMVKPVQGFFERLFAADREISTAIDELTPVPPRNWLARVGIGPRKSRVLAQFDGDFEDSDILRDIPRDHPVRELLLGPLTFFGHLDPDAPSSLHAVRLIARYFRGALTFNDRLGGLHALLHRAALDAGVVFREGSVVRELTLEGRKVTRIHPDGDRGISADFLIYNALSPLEELLPPSKANAKITEEARAVVPSKSLLVCNLLVKRAVIPCGMAEALFLLNGRRSRRADEPRDPPIFLRRYPAQRGEAKRGRGPEIDDTHEVISIAAPVRTQEVKKSPERLAALRTQLVARVRRLVPFLDDFTVETSLPSDTQHWDLEGDVVRAIDPWTLHPLYESEERPWLGVAARPNRGYLKNVIYAGRDIFPGLGLEGEYMTGLSAVDAIVQAAKKNV